MENNCVRLKTAFKSGEYVIYGTRGVCLIESITTLDWDNIPKNKLYYVLHPVDALGETIYIPVDNAETMLKRVLAKDEALKLIEQMPYIPPLSAPSEKDIEVTYKSCMRSFDRIEWIKLIKCVYLRTQKRKEQGKKSTAVDERYMHLATEALYSELSIVLGIPKDKMEEFICQNIKNQEEKKNGNNKN